MTQAMQFIAFGPACFIANKPRSMARREPVAHAPVSLVSKYGKRLPLRAIPYRDLNREFWSQGKTVFSTERSEPRELMAHEKEPCDMTWEEIRDTADREPLSESRRSWLTRGAGVLSFDLAKVEYDEGSIGETVAAKGITLEGIVDDAPEFADEASSLGNGIAYELLDPITAKQIDWEQRVHGDSEVTRVRLATNPTTGGLAINTDRKLQPDAFLRLAKSVKRTLATTFGSVANLDDLHARVDLIRDALDGSGVTIDFTSPDPDEERERFLAEADLEWHSSYEMPVPVVVRAEGTVARRPCWKRSCHTFEEHSHERITRIVHRSPRMHGHNDETWRQRIFDVTAFELGTDGLIDPVVMQI